MVRIGRIAAGLCRLGACVAAIGVGVAIGSNSFTERKPKPDTPPATRIETAAKSTDTVIPGPQGEAPAPAAASETGKAPPTIIPSAGNEPPTQPSRRESGIEVVQWRFGEHPGNTPGQSPQSDIVASRPVYLSMTLEGTQAAIDAMQDDHQLKIQVHWARETANGAPNLVTELTVGRPDLVDTLQQQVRRTGFFEWHSWARKDTLSPGTWTISLTYPDGQLLPCGHQAQPRRFTIDVG